MITTGTVTASFSAGHVVPGHLRCGRPHGHRWRIAVTIEAGQDPATGELHRIAELANEVEQICAEVDRESINEMFPGTSPTPIGVALAVRERLILSFPKVTKVQVWADDISATLS